jgi:hypothetical protein
MRGAIPPLPNTSSWSSAKLKHRYNFTFYLATSYDQLPELRHSRSARLSWDISRFQVRTVYTVQQHCQLFYLSSPMSDAQCKVVNCRVER